MKETYPYKLQAQISLVILNVIISVFDMLWLYILSLNTCIYDNFIIPYILIMNVESYTVTLSIAGGSNVREMCLNTNLLSVQLEFKHKFVDKS